MDKDADSAVLEYLKKIGQEGGRKRAKTLSEEEITNIARMGGEARTAKYGKRTLSRWAKMGGRPPKVEITKKAGKFYAHLPNHPGIHGLGNTEEEARQSAIKALKLRRRTAG